MEKNPQSIFFALEKRNKSKAHMQKLLANLHSSEEITEFNEVQNELKRFYKNLYTKQSPRGGTSK